MVTPERSYSTASQYRYGFNGKEKSDELYGEGNSNDFGGRMLDTRLGRWLSVDPAQKNYPNLSAYNYCANNPNIFIDPTGKLIVPVSADAVRIYEIIKKTADPATLTMLKNLNESDIIFKINITDNYGQIEPKGATDNVNGVTTFDAKTTEKTGKVTIDISIRLNDDYTLIKTLGDELEGSRQINEGELGLLDAGKGNYTERGKTTGYDIEDEAKSRIASWKALENAGKDLEGSDDYMHRLYKSQGLAALKRYLKYAEGGIYKSLPDESTSAFGGDSRENIKKDLKKQNFKKAIYREKKNNKFTTVIISNSPEKKATPAKPKAKIKSTQKS